MKKILILSNSSEGIYNFRLELIRELVQTDQLYISVPDSVAVKQLEEEGCEMIHTPMNRRGINPLEDMKLILAYRRLIRRIRPDVILTYTIKPNLYGGLMAGMEKVPFLPTITGLGTAFQKQGLVNKLVKILYRTSFQKAEMVFFQNARNRDLFCQEGLTQGRVRVVAGSGVNLDRHSREPYPGREKPLFLFVGRLMKEKGIEEFLEAAKVYASRADFVIVGDYEEDYREKVEKGVKDGWLAYHGPQRDVHPYYQEADAVIVASYHEGMSNVVLEAAATARPVLAANIPGCREGVEDNRTGLLFTPASSQALKEAIEAFLSLSRETRRAMGEAGRWKMEQEFDRNRIVETYLEEISLAAGQQK